jgi:hypothetical protein
MPLLWNPMPVLLAVITVHRGLNLPLRLERPLHILKSLSSLHTHRYILIRLQNTKWEHNFQHLQLALAWQHFPP